MNKKKAEKCKAKIMQCIGLVGKYGAIEPKHLFTYLRRWFSRYERELKQK